jgi:hypothetical protein
MKYAISADTIEYNGPSKGLAFLFVAIFVPVVILSLLLLALVLVSGVVAWMEALLAALLLCSVLVASLAMVSYRASRAFRLKINKKLQLVTTGRGKLERTEQIGDFQAILIQGIKRPKARTAADVQYHVYLAGSIRRTDLGIVSLSESGARQKITPIALFLELPVVLVPDANETVEAVEEKRECDATVERNECKECVSA